MPELPKILSRETVTRSRLFQVEGVRLQFSNGEERDYEYLKGSEGMAVAVVALPDTEHALLVREYSAGRHSYELALPRGRIEPEEGVLEGANRELQEETGFAARELKIVKQMTLSPSYMSHSTSIVLARDLYSSPLPGDEPEPLELVYCSLADLESIALQDDFSEARSLAALFLVRGLLERGEL